MITLYPLCLKDNCTSINIHTQCINNKENNDKGIFLKTDIICIIKYHNLVLLVKFILKSEFKTKDPFVAEHSMSSEHPLLLSHSQHRVTTNLSWKEEDKRDLIK